MITSVPSKIREMAEFIRPLVEDRLAKLEEFGETWDDAPVRSLGPFLPCVRVVIVVVHCLGSTGRYAYVADERSKGGREVSRRFGSEIAPDQLCGYQCDLSRTWCPCPFAPYVWFPYTHRLRVVQLVTQVLCRLLSNPEYIEPLRQEVEAAVAEEGWTKAGMDKMRKIDSFLRETQRVDVESIGPFREAFSSLLWLRVGR
jgi:hypothetical protein